MDTIGNLRFDYGYENEYDYEIFISKILSYKTVFIFVLDQLPFVSKNWTLSDLQLLIFNDKISLS